MEKVVKEAEARGAAQARDEDAKRQEPVGYVSDNALQYLNSSPPLIRADIYGSAARECATCALRKSRGFSGRTANVPYCKATGVNLPYTSQRIGRTQYAKATLETPEECPKNKNKY